MGIFESIQNLIGETADSALGNIGDIVGGLTENQALQDIQEQVTGLTDSVTDTVAPVEDQAQSAIDTITQNLK